MNTNLQGRGKALEDEAQLIDIVADICVGERVQEGFYPKVTTAGSAPRLADGFILGAGSWQSTRVGVWL